MKNNRLATYVLGLKPRERYFLAACVLVFAYFVLEFAVIRPLHAHQKTLMAEVERTELETSSLTQVLQVTKSNSAPDTTAKLKAERDAMNESIRRAETILNRTVGGSGSLDNLRRLTSEQGGIKLVSLRTLAPELLTIAASSPAPAPAPAQRASSAPAANAAPSLQVYRSAVELTVEGPYPALSGFISTIEQSAPQLLWGEVNIETVTYPLSRMRVTLYSIDTRPTGFVE